MNENNFESIAKPKYVTEYRKLGDLFKGRRPGEKSYLDKFILQTFISLIIVALVLFINNIDTSFTNSISMGIRTAISWNVDLSKTVDTFSNIKNLIPDAKKALSLDSSTEGETQGNGQGSEGQAAPDTGTALFIMPVNGEITSPFGERTHPVFKTKEMHNGIDISAELGTPILSAAAGRVAKVGADDINGNYLAVTTDNYEVVYAHCLKVTVKEGQQVKQGEQIAEVGDTGLVSGPHLHFEVKENGQPVDPMGLLNPSGAN